MGEKTGIAWCDSTFNPWIGCTKVGPGCDHCYAADQDSRKRWDGGKVHWGVGVPRYRTSAANWALPLRWNKRQELLHAGWNAGCRTLGGEDGLLKAGFSKPTPHRVFCSSLADVFDNEIPGMWREDLWDLVENTPHLEWLLLTKRIGNVPSMVPIVWKDGFPRNVRLMITVVNQEEADRDIPKLLALPCKNGVSYEPAVDFVNWGQWLFPSFQRHIDWIIVGGESGPAARSFDVDWARSTIAQCRAAGVPVFCKQLGTRPVFEHEEQKRLVMQDKACADPAEWPVDLRVQEFPV